MGVRYWMFHLLSLQVVNAVVCRMLVDGCLLYSCSGRDEDVEADIIEEILGGVGVGKDDACKRCLVVTFRQVLVHMGVEGQQLTVARKDGATRDGGGDEGVRFRGERISHNRQLMVVGIASRLFVAIVAVSILLQLDSLRQREDELVGGEVADIAVEMDVDGYCCAHRGCCGWNVQSGV